VVRAFHHGAIVIRTASQVRTPKDLEGRRVGVNRGYTVTTGVWARAILQEEYGVDLNSITWVLSGDEHVAEYVPPANVVSMAKGATLTDLVLNGDLAAAIGIDIDRPALQPLIPNPLEAGLSALRTRGHYPINHVMVVKDEVLRARPDAGPAMFEAFVAAKRLYLDRLNNGAIQKPTGVDELHRRVAAIIGDPLPYGLAPNRPVLESLIAHARSQGILERAVAPETLFPVNTLHLAG
jgi:4,5-dihydroxyphthalate decarboxylase